MAIRTRDRQLERLCGKLLTSLEKSRIDQRQQIYEWLDISRHFHPFAMLAIVEKCSTPFI